MEVAVDSGLSDYELARLERIKENRKMLEELFPEGTGLFIPGSAPSKGQRRRRVVRGGDSRGSGDSTPESGGTPTKKSYHYSARRLEVYPRRNPSRKARPPAPMEESDRPVTRSMSKGVSSNECLVDGLHDDQEVKRVVYRTVRRRIVSDGEELPIEIDGEDSFDPRKIKTVERSTDKVYDRARGSTCHQCRQKTIDTKTICHNRNCKGVRGQFCGPCLQNRYGEDLRDALLNKEWVCPPCRGICNCSFCLPKRGKPPTGILIHVARESGYDSVREYLDKTDYDY